MKVKKVDSVTFYLGDTRDKEKWFMLRTGESVTSTFANPFAVDSPRGKASIYRLSGQGDRNLRKFYKLSIIITGLSIETEKETSECEP